MTKQLAMMMVALATLGLAACDDQTTKTETTEKSEVDGGATIEHTRTTETTNDGEGNVTRETESKTTVDPEGLMNKETSTESTTEKQETE